MKFFRSGIRTFTTPDMKRLNIALMAGGDSSEREIALQSAAQIASALDPAKYDITLIDLHGRDWHYTSPDGRQWQVDKTTLDHHRRRPQNFRLRPDPDSRHTGRERPSARLPRHDGDSVLLLFDDLVGGHLRQNHDQTYRSRIRDSAGRGFSSAATVGSIRRRSSARSAFPYS